LALPQALLLLLLLSLHSLLPLLQLLPVHLLLLLPLLLLLLVYLLLLLSHLPWLQLSVLCSLLWLLRWCSAPASPLPLFFPSRFLLEQAALFV